MSKLALHIARWCIDFAVRSSSIYRRLDLYQMRDDIDEIIECQP